MLSKLERRARLNQSDQDALLSLPFTKTIVDRGKYLVREGAHTTGLCVLITGFAFRHRLTADGDRQIVSVHIPGDLVNVDGVLLTVADHNVQTLTRCEIGTIPLPAMLQLIDAHPQIRRALWTDTLIDGSIYREWVMNVGRRDARQRIAHLLCEFGRRLEVAGLGDSTGYKLPMTQEQLADATGLTAVHVNRSLKTMEAEGLVVREKRFVGVPRWERLRDLCGFNELYLQLDQVA